MNWREHFVQAPGDKPARQKCVHCSVELDVRAGRAQKHLKMHPELGEEGATEAVVASGAGSELPSSPSQFPVGSREWSVQKVIAVANNPAATPEQTLKAMDLLKEFEGFEGAGKFDDEVEKAKHMEQWERVLDRVKELRAVEKKLLKDPLVRHDLTRAMQEMAE